MRYPVAVEISMKIAFPQTVNKNTLAEKVEVLGLKYVIIITWYLVLHYLPQSFGLHSRPTWQTRPVCNNYKDITIDSQGKEQIVSVTEKTWVKHITSKSLQASRHSCILLYSKTDNNTIQSIFLELHMLIHFGNVYHVRHTDTT